MLTDGIYVLIKGKYIGTEPPGPWAILFGKLNIDVFKLGPLFVIYGISWLVFLITIVTKQPWAYLLGVILSVSTLWYLPVGAIVSFIILIILIANKAILQ